MPKTQEKTVRNKSLSRALTALDYFTGADISWGIRELAREMNSDPATVYRTLSTLNHSGYLEKDPSTNRYRLGPKILMLAGSYSDQNPIQAVANKVFEQYSQSFTHNFYLGQLFKNEVIYIAVKEGHGPIKISVSQGNAIALYSTALGKVLLAYQDNDHIERYIRNTKFVAYTELTITDPIKLMDSIYQIRALGYAINHGERHPDIGSVGVPLLYKNHKTNIAVSIAYPQHLVNEKKLRLESLVNLTKEIATEINRRTSLQSFEYLS